MVVDHSLRTDDVAETVVRVVWPLDGAGLTRKLDNGSEFAHKVMDRWAYEDGVELDFSPSDTPTDNAMVDASTADSGRSV